MSSQTEGYDVPVLKNHVLYHAFITHCEADLVFAMNLLKQIEQHHFRCIFAKRDFNVGAAVIDNIANAISSSRRTVLVISKASLRSQWSPDEDWEDHIPAGNVAHGLAWSYYFGYLKFLLPGMDKRIECSKHWKTDSTKRRMCKKILLLYPSSCHCRLRRLDEDSSGRITHEGEVELLQDRAGVVGRVYKNTVYSVVSKEGKKFYFVGEYVTCIRTMYEMEQSGIAGLKPDDTRLLSTKFLITIKQILDRDKDCTNMYRIIFYEDSDQSGKTASLPDHIVKAIDEEMEMENADGLDPLVRQHAIDSGISIEKDSDGQTESIQLGNEIINIF
ncbi:stimulator of interferon genes protein-like isoform X4 [Mizuhopecten yessoensis]|uniref:stimulator of interferon genes protein-like isoform X4 n=1 Tax=Mizuhopecten yessoensis TaxID=6573 RepID=UPI000B458BDE|nr:stimulator of interferon genes protein-like isoform X4 [Mizuhopecten yessoensis]